MTDHRGSRTECLGSVRPGTHLCEFHSTHEELTDTLAPYFAAGAKRGEFCVWITTDPKGVEGAKSGLRKAAPHLERYLDSGQIEIWDYRDWYLHHGHFDADRVFGQWVEKEKRALDSGYKGLWATGDMAWLQKPDWPAFMAYEAEVNRALPRHRLTGLCTYLLDGCPADAVLEVVRNHQFSLARVAGQWELIQNERSQQFSAEILQQRDDERRWIADQLHEVTAQNISAISMYIANLQQRKSWSSGIEFVLENCRTLCEQSLEQVLSLSHLLHPPMLDKLGLAVCLRQYIDDFVKRNHMHVELETEPAIGRLPLEMETHLFRVAQEGLSNVLLHSGSLNAIVRLRRQADEVILQIEDFGRGMPKNAGKPGLGIFAMQERLRKVGGHLEIRSSDQGTLLSANIRLS